MSLPLLDIEHFLGEDENAADHLDVCEVRARPARGSLTPDALINVNAALLAPGTAAIFCGQLYALRSAAALPSSVPAASQFSEVAADGVASFEILSVLWWASLCGNAAIALGHAVVSLAVGENR